MNAWCLGPVANDRFTLHVIDRFTVHLQRNAEGDTYCQCRKKTGNSSWISINLCYQYDVEMILTTPVLSHSRRKSAVITLKAVLS